MNQLIVIENDNVNIVNVKFPKGYRTVLAAFAAVFVALKYILLFLRHSPLASHFLTNMVCHLPRTARDARRSWRVGNNTRTTTLRSARARFAHPVRPPARYAIRSPEALLSPCSGVVCGGQLKRLTRVSRPLLPARVSLTPPPPFTHTKHQETSPRSQTTVPVSRPLRALAAIHSRLDGMGEAVRIASIESAAGDRRREGFGELPPPCVGATPEIGRREDIHGRLAVRRLRRGHP